MLKFVFKECENRKKKPLKFKKNDFLFDSRPDPKHFGIVTALMFDDCLSNELLNRRIQI